MLSCTRSLSWPGFCLHLSQTSEFDCIHPHTPPPPHSFDALNSAVSRGISQSISQPVVITLTQSALLAKCLHVSPHQNSLILKYGLGVLPMSSTPAQQPSASCGNIVIVCHCIFSSSPCPDVPQEQVPSLFCVQSNVQYIIQCLACVCGQFNDLLDEYLAESCQKHKDAIPDLRIMIQDTHVR